MIQDAIAISNQSLNLILCHIP